MKKSQHSPRSLNRREFVKLTVTTGLLASTGAAWAVDANPAADIPRRPLGRTGEQVSILGLGGFHIGVPDEAEGIRIIRSAIDRGVNFMDNCWDYHNGGSEVRMGKALRDGYRDKVFLMTKIDSRSKAGAAKQIDECLQRLQTDRIDLMQFHEMVRLTDPDGIFAAGGALEAVLAAKQAGKIRFIGFTGHKSPEIHLRTLELAAKNKFRFDTVQMPLNVMDAHFHSFEKQVVPELVKDGIGVLGMKPLGAGAIARSGLASATECLHYAMSLPTATVITGMDSMEMLDQGIAAARSFKPLTPEQRTALLARTATAAADGKYEQFKTTGFFDGTVNNPKWTI
ncbi:MAG TPA: aldo/keto reductase [Dongiaceae bacterium]|nr:aldo/keto reductase [Dongiaceae bacterium]